MAKIELQVNGMSCQHCVQAIEKALGELGASGRVNLEHRSVVVEYDESRLSLEQVKSAIEDQGYDVVQ
jgi:copper chaperone